MSPVPLCRRVAWSVAALVVVVVIAVGFGFWRAGYRAYDIHTGSMAPALVPGDLVVDRPAADGLHPGEIITFQHSAGPDLVTHRITSITGGVIRTKGDANRTADVWDIAPDMVHGSVLWRLPKMGYVAVYVQQPLGLVSIFTVSAGLILLWQLFFPSTPAGGSPVPAATGNRHRRTPRPVPAAGTRWRTTDPVEASTEAGPAARARHARPSGGTRHIAPAPAVADPVPDPASTGRHFSGGRAPA